MALNFGPVPMNFEALGSLGKTFFDAQAAAQKRGIEQQKQQLLSGLGQGSGDYQKVGLGLIGAGDVQSGVALLGLAQKDREQKLAEEAYKTSPFSSSAAPQAPTSPSSASIGNPNEVESRFIGGVKQAGLVNPVGLAAVAAYGKAESGFSPQNVNRTWNDPSESGQPGQSGGILSWRADRLQKLQSFAAQRGEQGNGSPETQATFLAQEDPTLIPRLNAARTPQEANQIMANAWRFAGYNREGGENARRLALTQQYAGRFGAGGGQASATVPLGSPPQLVQVAENEADVARIEAQMPGYGGAPAQVAQAPAQVGAPVADAPAPGAQPVQGFAVPPGEAGKLPPNDPFPQVTNEQLVQVIRNPRSSPGDKALAQQLFASRQAYASETAPEKREQARLETRKKDLEVQKLERELAGAEPIPLTAEERQKFGIAPDQAAYRTRDGIKFGPAGTKIINEAQKLQSAEDKARVDVNTKFLGKLADSGPQVSQRMADMDILATVVRDAPQVPVSDPQIFFDRIGAGLGLSKGELATRSDAMKAIIQRLAPAQREEGSGSTSDIEFKGMLASFPSLATTPEGRQMILTTIARQNEITRMRIEVADQWTQGEIPATEARKRIAQIDRASIYASEDEKKLVRKLAGTAKGGDTGKASPALEREIGGKIYVQRGGQWYVKEGN